MNKNVIIYLIIIIALLVAYLAYERVKFPVSYNICSKGYSDCSIIARFSDMGVCEYAREKESLTIDTYCTE